MKPVRFQDASYWLNERKKIELLSNDKEKRKIIFFQSLFRFEKTYISQHDVNIQGVLLRFGYTPNWFHRTLL